MSKIEIHQSKYGFHPCDYETYKKLKFLHKHYWQTLYDFHAWWRWERKDEDNRKGPEPSYCSVFVENKSWWKKKRQGGNDSVVYLPKTVVDHGIVELYHKARMPQSEPLEIFSEETLRKINRLYDAVVGEEKAAA
jgi:hypothetical protein